MADQRPPTADILGDGRPAIPDPLPTLPTLPEAPTLPLWGA